MVEVERFDISKVPDHGRPRVMELRGREGILGVHCSRDDGSLWLFAAGPSGGDRGHVVFPVRMAGQLAAWLDGGAENSAAPSTTGALWLDPRKADRVLGERMLVLAHAGGARKRWQMLLDENARDELMTALREWAEAAVKLGG